MSAKWVSVAENFIYKADAFKEFLPVKCGNQTHAGNDIAHRHAHGPLFLVFGADNFIGVRSRKGQALIEPKQNGADLGVQIPQALYKLHRERRLQWSFLKPFEGPAGLRIALPARASCRLMRRLRGGPPCCLQSAPPSCADFPPAPRAG